MRSHNHPLWTQEDLDRYHSDERATYGAISLAEECSGPPPGWEEPPIVMPLDFLGPPDWLNPKNMAHQRQNMTRDELERISKEFQKLKTQTL